MRPLLRTVLFLPLVLLLDPTLALNPQTTRTCVDADAVSHTSTQALTASLSALTANSTFFSIFRVALDKTCPFWADTRQCAIRECSVCNCEENEIPPAWRQPLLNTEHCASRLPNPGPVDRALPLFLKPRWRDSRDQSVWTVQDRDADAQYVDLRKNPEQYTGYSGAHANSIWRAIYDENCFEFAASCRSGVCDNHACKEERVLYRLISGVHTSITAHLAKRYLFDSGVWGENVLIFRQRIAAHPERIQNLNVAFAVVARAVAKVSKHIHPHHYQYVTGDGENDVFTRNGIARVLDSPLLEPDCLKPTFDESSMFLQDQRHRLAEFRGAFRNISKIMDCVGCEKCRLWGKLQFLGLGTSLRILFDDRVPKLQRNEVIALLNLLHKLSQSVLWVDRMAERESVEKMKAKMYMTFGAAFAFTTIVLIGLQSGRSAKKSRQRRSKSRQRTRGDTKSRLRTSDGEEGAVPVEAQKKSRSKKQGVGKVQKRARHVPRTLSE